MFDRCCITLFFSSIFWSFPLMAQVDSAQTDYVLLYDGSFIPSDNIGLVREGFGTTLKVSVDDRTFPARQVRGVHSNGSYFANLSHLNALGSVRFVRRAHHGKLDLYEREVINVHVALPIFVVYPSKLRYFSKDNGPVLKMNLANLWKHLQDSPESMRHLRTGRILMLSGFGMLAGGIAGIIVGNSRIDDTQWDAPIPKAIPIGAITACLSWIPMVIAPFKSRKAVESYTGYTF